MKLYVISRQPEAVDEAETEAKARYNKMKRIRIQNKIITNYEDELTHN